MSALNTASLNVLAIDRAMVTLPVQDVLGAYCGAVAGTIVNRVPLVNHGATVAHVCKLIEQAVAAHRKTAQR